eukprot:9479155-Pyramimonas_sp.AAC.1
MKRGYILTADQSDAGSADKPEVRLVHHENIPARTASDWSIMRRCNGPRKAVAIGWHCLRSFGNTSTRRAQK